MGQGLPVEAISGSNYIEPPAPHYMVWCNKHFMPQCVYSGPSESNYDYYNSDPSRGCSMCAEAETYRQETEARQRAYRAKCKEEQRVRQLKEKLEREKRQKLEEAQQHREAEREAEEKRMKAQIAKEEQERIARNKKYLNVAKEEMVKQEIKKLKSRKTKHPITAFTRCDTAKVIEELGNEALKYGVAGHIISERVDAIKSELQTALQDDYKLVESEVKRYEKYGKEMKGIITEFIDAFGAVFRKADGHKDQFDDDADALGDTKCQDEKEMYQDDIKDDLNELAKSINNMKFKLLLMEQYYDKMKEDYQVMIDFIDITTKDLKSDKIRIDFLKATADDIRTKKAERDIFDGQENYEEIHQKGHVEQNYVRIVHSNITRAVPVESKRYVDATDGGHGYAIGGMIGAGIGTVAGGPVFGGIGNLAGGLLGAAIGSLFDKKEKKVVTTIKYESEFMGVTRRENASIKLKIDKLSYNGIEQANALDKIRNAMEVPIDNFIRNLTKKNESAKEQLTKFEDLQKSNKKLIKYVVDFKENVDDLREILEQGNEMKDSHRKILNKKWKETSEIILSQLKSMEYTNNK